jgi:hypothetical protein
MRLVWLCLVMVATLAAEDNPSYTFGTTVVDTSGFEGHVYTLKEGAEKLPAFKEKEAAGTIYTRTLNVWPQPFDDGFPGITDRFEWFAIDYKGKFWVEKPGRYRFSLLADDGAKLWLNDKLVINNDGIHAARAFSAEATLTRGVHQIRVSYYQGPRFTVALVLAVAPPGEPWRIFHTDDFKPPKDPDQWVEGKITGVGPQTSR